MYLLDTNIVSEFRRIKPHGGVQAWTNAQDHRSLLIPAIVLGEIQRGIEITRLKDKARADVLEEWIVSIFRTFTIIDMDGPICREWAKLMRGKSNDLIVDAMIAATARVRGLTVVTRNTRDFAPFQVTVYDPFNYRG